jgi:hypothetical protein
MPTLPVCGDQSGLTSPATRPQALTDHSRTQSAQRHIIGQPVCIEWDAVIAPWGNAVDEQITSAMAADAAHGNELECLAWHHGTRASEPASIKTTKVAADPLRRV